MLNIEALLDRIDLHDLVERAGARLRRAGQRWVGACPLHGGDNATAFNVYEGEDGRERWHCFTGCQAGGDAIDFVSRWKNLEFHDAVKWLAELAGMSLQELGLSAELAAREQSRRSLSQLRARAVEYYRRKLWSETEAGQIGRQYALDRGWTEETIRAAGLGLADGQLWKKATEVDVSLDDLWRAGLIKRDGKRAWDTIPAGYLVYPHRRGERVEFLAGRAIWELVDPESQLDADRRAERKARNVHNESGETPRRPFWVGPMGEKVLDIGERVLVVVEGQADAVTLAQAGMWAVALAGGSADEDLVERLRRWKGTLILGLDGDVAGHEFARALVERLYPLTQVVTSWPGGKDANEALITGLGQADLEMTNGALIKTLVEAPDWLELEIQRVAQVRRRKVDAMRALFRLMVQLDDFELEVWREKACAVIPTLSASAFSRFLAAARREAGDGVTSGSWAGRYTIEEGRICQIRQREGGTQLVPLCNFSARVVADVARDDGEEVERVFEMAGKLDTGASLSSCQVAAVDFAKMEWVPAAWGVRAVLRAGRGVRDQLREALQLQSLDAPATRVYTHTGWRVIEGQRVFLTGAGGVGAKSPVQVDLDDALRGYTLPVELPSTADIRAGMVASLQFLVVGLSEVVFPLWSAVWLAPLSEILEPAFVLWQYGPTGCLKSSLAALAMCHYGTFTDRSLRVQWADTANSLEMRCFTAKDVPLVIDDFAPAATSYDARQLEQNAARIVRAVGNRAGRGRLTRDIRQRRVFRPRGLVLSTGEQLPSGQSITARLVTVEMGADCVDRELLTVAQTEAGRYPLAMVGYLNWVAGQWDTLGSELLTARADLRARVREEGSHLRLPEALANLYLGLDLGLAFAVEVSAISEGVAEDMRQHGWAALLGLVRSQAERVQMEQPCMRFLAVLSELLAQGRAWLCPVDEPGRDSPKVGSELMGYFDAEGIYLLADAAFRLVVQRERESGVHFPVKRNTLHRNLADEGLIVPGVEAGRMTTVISAGGRSVRVLRLSVKAEEWIARPEIEEEPEAEDEDVAPLMPEMFQ